jgi:DNA-binding response OmpR family regulator
MQNKIARPKRWRAPLRNVPYALLRRFALSIYSPGRTRTLDSHASRLRQKLGAVSDRPWIVNVWGHGYRVTAPE